MNGSPVEHYDEYDANGLRVQRPDAPAREQVGTRRLAIYAGAAAGALALMAVVAFLWQQGTERAQSASALVLPAEPGAIRTRPDQAGGPSAPGNYDIFDTLGGEQPVVPPVTTAVPPNVEEPLPDPVPAPVDTAETSPTIAPPVLPDVTVPPPPQAPDVGNITPPQLPGEPTPSEVAVTPPAEVPAAPLSGSLTDMIGEIQNEQPATAEPPAETPPPAAEPQVAALAPLPAGQTPPVPRAKPPVPVAARPATTVTPPAATGAPTPTVGDDAYNPAAPASTAPATRPAPAAGGGSYVQLASVPSSETAARSAWTQLQRDNPRLSGLSLRLQQADVRGTTYYRIQGGPLSAGDAQSLCDSLKAEGKGCLVVR